MILFTGIVVGICLGACARGRLARLKDAQLRGEGLFVALLLLNVALPRLSTVSPSLGMVALYAWTAGMGGLALLAFANRTRPGMAVVGVGILANLAVILLNRGMPVSVEAIRASGFSGSLGTVMSGDVFHRLFGSGTRLPLLGDVLPIPGPRGVRSIGSIGDVLMLSGIAVFLAGEMLRPDARAPISRAPKDAT